jgi:MFS family permease
MRFKPQSRPSWTLVTVSLGGMIVGLDGTALTIAGPDIAQTAGASLTELQWIANAYLVALAVALFPAGRLADRAGRRRARSWQAWPGSGSFRCSSR